MLFSRANRPRLLAVKNPMRVSGLPMFCLVAFQGVLCPFARLEHGRPHDLAGVVQTESVCIPCTGRH